MSNNTTLARPYGKAAFEYALQHQQLAEWSTMLKCAVVVVRDPMIAKYLGMQLPSLSRIRKDFSKK